jgi:hypothetical protein
MQNATVHMSEYAEGNIAKVEYSVHSLRMPHETLSAFTKYREQASKFEYLGKQNISG